MRKFRNRPVHAINQTSDLPGRAAMANRENKGNIGQKLAQRNVSTRYDAPVKSDEPHPRNQWSKTDPKASSERAPFENIRADV
jgi:hypothetical protein